MAVSCRASQISMGNNRMTPTELRSLWWRFLAWARLSEKAICTMSINGRDYHDYPDGHEQWPMHFHTYQCRRCGKEFSI